MIFNPLHEKPYVAYKRIRVVFQDRFEKQKKKKRVNKEHFYFWKSLR